MNKIFTVLIFFLLVCSSTVFSQQEAHYSNFMYNQQLYNPAYVGSRNTPSFTGLHRSQWISLEGAPHSQILSFQTPIMKQRAGVGGTLSRYSIGITYSWYGAAAYAYNLRLTQNLDLRIGLHGTLKYMGIDFSDPRVVTVSQNDPSITEDEFTSKYNANVGVGLYLTYKDIFYFGASSPQLYPSEIGLNNLADVTAQASPHRYFTTGAVIPVSDELEFMPNMLVKWVDHAPVDGDINFSVRYLKQLTAGLTYRVGGNKSGESIDLLMFFQFNQKIGAGLSYDFTMSDVKDYESGSVEIFARYDLRDEKENLENPRYFKNK